MLYEATVFTTYFGQQCIWRWNYVSTGTPASVSGSFGLVSAMGGIPPTLTPTQFPESTMMEVIREAVSSAVQFNAISVKAIYDVVDFYELPWVPTITGVKSGDALSPVMGYGFRTNRVRTDIRRGTKRIEGVIEADVGSGGVLVGDGAAYATAIATRMSATLSYDDEGNTLTYVPTVVSKEPYIPPGSTRTAYRYYPTLTEQMEHVASGVLWQPYANVRSQTSRQYGRGQ